MNDKERMEEIKSEIERSNNTVEKGNLLGAERMILDLHEIGRFEWLVNYAKEQAERVQELELECAGWKEAVRFEDEKLANENKRYREKLEFIQDIQQWHRKEPDYEVLNIVNEALEGDE